MDNDENEQLPVEIKKELVTLLSDDQDIKKLLTVSFKETVISTYNSHFPKSQELQKLEKIVPGITERMLTMMEKHQDREIAFDKEMLKTENRRIDTIGTASTKEQNTTRLSHILGFIIAAGVLSMATWLIYLKEYGIAIGLIMGAGSIAGIVSAFTGYISKNNTPADNNEE